MTSIPRLLQCISLITKNLHHAIDSDVQKRPSQVRSAGMGRKSKARKGQSGADSDPSALAGLAADPYSKGYIVH